MNLLKFIPKQVHIPYVGAMFDLSTKLLAIVGLFNFVALTRGWYYDENDPILRDLFGSYLLFMFVMGLIGLVVIIALYVFLVPSSNSYAQKQAVIEGRSPMYEKLCDVENRLRELEKKL